MRKLILICSVILLSASGLHADLCIDLKQWEPYNLNNEDRKSTRLNSSHTVISYAVFCWKQKKGTRNN